MADYEFLTESDKAQVARELGLVRREFVYDADGNHIGFEYVQDDTMVKRAAEKAHYRESLTARLKGESEPPLVVTDTPGDVVIDVPVVKGPK